MEKGPIGERIRAARRMARLSQRELAKRVGVSPMAISKYERGLVCPDSAMLIRLATELGVSVDYLLRPSRVTVVQPAFRKRVALPKKELDSIVARIEEWVERYLEIEAIVGGEAAVQFDLSAKVTLPVNSYEEIEDRAVELRQAWKLGDGPIPNLVELLEERGIRVGVVDSHHHFDGLTFVVDNSIWVIVTRKGVPGDRQRFSLAHELGHLVLALGDDVDAEKAANRFASAFLVPKSAAIGALGRHRDWLDLYELHMLKHLYGLSMQGWICRARDLGIISEHTAQRLFRCFRARGWHKEEPGDQLPPEEPTRLQRLVQRALAEGLISESRAGELLGMPLHQWRKIEAQKHGQLPFETGARYKRYN